MEYNLINLKTHQLDKNLIGSICKLKNSHWKTTIKLQKEFFKKNCRKKDIHSILIFKKKLIGYTMLRKRKLDEKKFYLLFDTMIINKKFRNKGFARVLMSYNNFVIKKNRLSSILICEKELVNFYKKFSWKLCDFKTKNRFKFTMSYNYENLYNKKLSKKKIYMRTI
tara:strand:- start:4590 stop:5090 length:501 start_codon:yes stop_codon:yes gene_type:complete